MMSDSKLINAIADVIDFWMEERGEDDAHRLGEHNAERVLLAIDEAGFVVVPKQLKPDHVYDPDDWEATYEWDDRDSPASDMLVGDVRRFSTLIQGPDWWAAHVVVTRDEAGEPDETEVRWFDSEAEARIAIRV